MAIQKYKNDWEIKLKFKAKKNRLFIETPKKLTRCEFYGWMMCAIHKVLHEEYPNNPFEENKNN